MSSSDDVDVQQKKDAASVVTWREYEALRDHLKLLITKQDDHTTREIQNVQLQLGQNDETVQAVQTQVTNVQTQVTELNTHVTAIQQSITALTQAVQNLRPMFERQPAHAHVGGHGENDDADARVHGENYDDLNAHAYGGGRAHGRAPGRGRGFAPIGAHRVAQPVNVQQQDGLGKPKFSIPIFTGSSDLEEYLT
jgi:hypothetical protein